MPTMGDRMLACLVQILPADFLAGMED